MAKKRAIRKRSGKKRMSNAAFMMPMTPSPALAAIVGSRPMPRTEVTKKIWSYIKRNRLQDPANRRLIKVDEKLRGLLADPGTDDPGPRISMFNLGAIIRKNLK